MKTLLRKWASSCLKAAIHRIELSFKLKLTFWPVTLISMINDAKVSFVRCSVFIRNPILSPFKSSIFPYVDRDK